MLRSAGVRIGDERSVGIEVSLNVRIVHRRQVVGIDLQVHAYWGAHHVAVAVTNLNRIARTGIRIPDAGCLQAIRGRVEFKGTGVNSDRRGVGVPAASPWSLRWCRDPGDPLGVYTAETSP